MSSTHIPPVSRSELTDLCTVDKDETDATYDWTIVLGGTKYVRLSDPFHR